jgi:hypothetical protein
MEAKAAREENPKYSGDFLVHLHGAAVPFAREKESTETCIFFKRILAKRFGKCSINGAGSVVTAHEPQKPEPENYYKCTMKRLLFAVLSSTAALIGFNASAGGLEIEGPFTINGSVYQQSGDGFTLSHSNATHTAKSTNVVETYTASMTKLTFNNAFLLGLLANSFKTNLTGAHLATTGNGLVTVVDKTGTNQILDITPVVTSVSSNNVFSGTRSVTVSTGSTGITNSSTTSRPTSYEYIVLSYNDSNQTTADGTQTVFVFDGVSTSGSTDKLTGLTDKVSGHYSLTGGGAGIIRGTNSVISATMTGSASGTEVIPD